MNSRGQEHTDKVRSENTFLQKIVSTHRTRELENLIRERESAKIPTQVLEILSQVSPRTVIDSRLNLLCNRNSGSEFS